MSARRSSPICPLPLDESDECVTLAHGEGGRLMRRLIQQRIVPAIPGCGDTGDAARVGRFDGDVLITTDTFVVSPLFFPGGDIGSLSIHGTVNDLAVSGARPICLTLSLIIEDGFPLRMLDRVLSSIAAATRRCDVRVVTGDTKVVPVGTADQLFINTCGVGQRDETAPPGPDGICENDVLIVSGPIGRHGIAVMAARENLQFDPPPASDSAPLHEATGALQSALGDRLRCMRDATRGGVAAVLHEWADASGKTMNVEASRVPVTDDVRGASELLGIDPLHVANEGTFLAAVAPGSESEALAALHDIPVSQSACVIGTVTRRGIAPVVREGLLGDRRPIDEPAGAPMPRIC